MDLIPNPADGIVNALSMRSGKEVGICKSCFDIVNVAAAFLIGLAHGDPLLGIGVGTILSMLCIGRYISLFNKFSGGSSALPPGWNNLRPCDPKTQQCRPAEARKLCGAALFVRGGEACYSLMAETLFSARALAGFISRMQTPLKTSEPTM